MKVFLVSFLILAAGAVNAQSFNERTIHLSVGSQKKHFKSGYIKVGDVNYHYLAKGDKSKPLMLFLHGFPEMSAAWKNQLSFFSKNYFAVAVDMKGYNLTSISAPTAKYANYSAAQVASEINTLALILSNGKPYFLVGHDWGATISWNVAFSFPKNLRALVVINGAHSLQYFKQYFSKTDPWQYEAAEYIRNILSSVYTDQFYIGNDSAELRKILFDNDIGESKKFFNDEMQRLYLNYWRTTGSVDAGLNYYRAINFALLEPLYAEGSLPIEENPAEFLKKYHVQDGVKTLVIWGERDIYITSKVNDGLEKFFNNPADLTIKRYGKYSHWIVHEASDLITKEIEAFASDK